MSRMVLKHPLALGNHHSKRTLPSSQPVNQKYDHVLIYILTPPNVSASDVKARRFPDSSAKSARVFGSKWGFLPPESMYDDLRKLHFRFFFKLARNRVRMYAQSEEEKMVTSSPYLISNFDSTSFASVTQEIPR